MAAENKIVANAAPVVINIASTHVNSKKGISDIVAASI